MVVRSPLRYPGAKRRFRRLIRDTIAANNLKPKLFVEPFAGGASVALQMAHDSTAAKIGLAEIDPLVSSFWKAVFWDTDWLASRIRRTAVTLDRWRELKDGVFSTDRERAFACLFLNRTSFSGIISPTGGPLGGNGQSSAYKLDCRFPRRGLVARIRQIAKLRDKVAFVRTAPWTETVSYVAGLGLSPKDVFFYLDPPFYKKADRLYRYFFEESEHVALRDALAGIASPWFLSYDPAERIRELYSNMNGSVRHVEVLYSAGQGACGARKELIITNLEQLPIGSEFRTYESRRRPACPV